MKENKEKWISDVFKSLNGSQRATPNRDLLAKIEEDLFKQEAMIVPIFPMKMAISAAVILLCLNTFAIKQFLNNTPSDNSEIVSEDHPNHLLISDYKLYD